MFQAGLAPEGRPAGVFLLLGPTGTGKTKTVEAISEILHGSEKKVVKIDCGEFQMEHEVAKLIGAPPGYLGHRETESILNQQRINAASSDRCELSVVLFDEIEKAAPSVTRLLLGILDKATLRLGDNTEVNFEKSLIFFTSNLGAREMLKEIHPDFGFRTAIPPNWQELAGRLENIALAAVRKMYSPEFVNRIDAVITYQPLDKESFSAILDQHIGELQKHVNTRLGNRCFNIEIPEETRQFLLQRGTSSEYGARELKRTIHRYLTQPLATMVIESKIEPGSCVRAELAEDGNSISLQAVAAEPAVAPEHPTVLIVDDNQALLRLLAEHLKANTGWRIVTVETVKQAQDAVSAHTPDLALLDFLLPDGNGVRLGVNLKLRFPAMQGIIMTGAELPAEEEAICSEYDFRIVHKPFLAGHVLNLIRERLFRASGAAR
jgi:CheY-like chemotaxis protein